jgi:hypothetical protein
MARKPAAPAPSGGAPRRPAKNDRSAERGERTKPVEPAKRGKRTAPGERAEPGERFGPVAIERMRKDDGRSLIIYSREGGDGT